MGSQLSWNAGLKILFRFIFIYFILFIFPFPLNVFDFFHAEVWSTGMWNVPVVWLGKTLFDLDITVFPNGSGDTTWNYVQVLLFGMIAVTGCVIWSVADRGRSHYGKLFFWLNVLVRYYLGSTMLSYGIYKIIKTQFPFPRLERLLQNYGDSSPMGLLWTFMGYSPAYNFYTGLAEALGGFLLFFKRTRMLGALICIGVMSNVVMLNFTYDVPVKLFSLHLLFMAIFLVAPDANRLLDFFLLNRTTQVEDIQPLFRETKWFYTYAGAKALFIGYIIVSLVVMVSGQHKKWGDGAAKSVLYGIYEVKKYAINGDTIPALMNDTRRWKRVVVSSGEWGSVEYMDNAKLYYRFYADTLQGKASIHSQDSSIVYKFAHTRKNDHIVWIGGSEHDSIFVEMKRRDPNELLLVNRGFNWINEYPYNR